MNTLYKDICDLIERFLKRAYLVHLGFYNNLELGTNVDISRKSIIRTSKTGQEKCGTIKIGSNFYCAEYTHIYSSKNFIRIGNDCTINQFCVLDGHGGIEIGNNVRIANHTSIISSNHNYKNPDELIRNQGHTAKGITIKDDVWIGSNVKILDGVTIGKGCVIGAGSVVTKSIPDYSVAVGVPAKIIKSRS